jgi:hypothetical protein
MDLDVQLVPPPASPSNVFNGYSSPFTSTYPDPGLVLQWPSAPSTEITPTRRKSGVNHHRRARNKKPRLNSPDIDPINTVDEENQFFTDALAEAQPDVPAATLPTHCNKADQYEHYVDATLSGAAGFFQISAFLFVAHGWDARSTMATV